MVNVRPESSERPHVSTAPKSSRLKETLDKILDKGVVIDAQTRIALGDCDLLALEAILILSSFKTAALIGLDFPEGINLDTPAWKDLLSKQPCPLCGKESRPKDLKDVGCPWCGWNYYPMDKESEETFDDEREKRYGRRETVE